MDSSLTLRSKLQDYLGRYQQWGVSIIPIASRSSDINWHNILIENKRVQEFIKSVLIYSNNSFDEYINKETLSIFLDNCFSQKAENDSTNLFTKALKNRIKKHEHLVKIVRKFRPPWKTSFDSIIFRLLSLKIWFDLFVDE